MKKIRVFISSVQSEFAEERQMLYPDNPNHPQQRYRLTIKGIQLKNQIKE